MKICENGVVREMTAAEIAGMQRDMPASRVEALTNNRKLELMLAAIPTAPTPSTEPKLGYKWQPMYTPSSGFAWELVEDPTALGTARNPRYWIEGLELKAGHYYTINGKDLLIAVKDGVAPAFEAGEWLEQPQ